MRQLVCALASLSLLVLALAQTEPTAPVPSAPAPSQHHEEVLKNLKSIQKLQQELLQQKPSTQGFEQAVAELRSSLPAAVVDAVGKKIPSAPTAGIPDTVAADIKHQTEHLASIRQQQEAAASRLENSVASLTQLLERLNTDVSTLGQTASQQHSTNVKLVNEQSQETSRRLEKLEQQVAQLTTLVQAVVESTKSAKKSEDGAQIHTLLDSQSKIYDLLQKLHDRHNESFIHQTKEKVVALSIKAYQLAVSKGHALLALVTQHAQQHGASASVFLSQAMQNATTNTGPMLRQYYANGRQQALETHKTLSAFVAKNGVPHEHAQLVAAIGLIIGALLAAFVLLYILLVLLRLCCCCGRSRKVVAPVVLVSGQQKGKKHNANTGKKQQ